MGREREGPMRKSDREGGAGEVVREGEDKEVKKEEGEDEATVRVARKKKEKVRFEDNYIKG